jgi:hypothetical protein
MVSDLMRASTISPIKRLCIGVSVNLDQTAWRHPDTFVEFSGLSKEVLGETVAEWLDANPHLKADLEPRFRPKYDSPHMGVKSVSTDHAIELANAIFFELTAKDSISIAQQVTRRGSTVAALTMKTPDCRPSQTEESHAQSNRSVAVSFGRFAERFRTQT